MVMKETESSGSGVGAGVWALEELVKIATTAAELREQIAELVEDLSECSLGPDHPSVKGVTECLEKAEEGLALVETHLAEAIAQLAHKVHMDQLKLME